MKKHGLAGSVALALLIAVAMSGAAHGYHVTAYSSKILYEKSEILEIDGTVNTNTPATVYIVIYNSSDAQIFNVSTVSNVSGNISTFSKAIPLSSFQLGKYYALVYNQPDESVRLEFEVVDKALYIRVRLLNTSEVVMVNTSTVVSTPSYAGGNFTDFLASGYEVHYGTAGVLAGGATAHFVLVNQTAPGVFDTIYVDDDPRFELYNSAEDAGSAPMVETPLRRGDKVGDYSVVDVEFGTGNRVLLAKLRPTSSYSAGEQVRYLVVVRDSSGRILDGLNLSVELRHSNGTLIASSSGVLQNGYLSGSFTAPSRPGSYMITVNSTLGMEVFSVDTFRLFGKITDVGGNPMSVFAPDPRVKVVAVAKSLSGEMLNLTNASARITYPNGTSVTLELSPEEQGVYSGELNLAGAPTGDYGVTLTGAYASTQQEVTLGFTVARSRAELYAINVRFIDQADEGGVFVNAFHPGGDVTLLAVLSDVTKGGMMASGPEGAGIIPIDDPSTPVDECTTRVELTELKDERDVSYLGNVSVSIMNLSNFLDYLSSRGAAPSDPPPESLLTQCMVVVSNLSKQGTYRAKVRITVGGESRVAGAAFGVQELYAYGTTVDFNGEDFSFNVPNSTLRVRLNVQNLLTRDFLPPESIVDANIVSLRRDFPSYREVDISTIAPTVNVSGGVMSFQAPSMEGFFTMRFRFKANVSGEIKEGVGNAYFMLKKYIIWAEPACSGEFGPCVFPSTSNVSLRVYIADASKGSLLDLGATGSALCTTCDGLVAKVRTLRNDQLGVEVPESEYGVYGGGILNGKGVMNLSPSSGEFSTGWYGVDVEVYNPSDPNESYFGFGWFEVRNFFVDVLPVKTENGTLMATRSWGSSTYPVNSSIAFAVIPRDPADWSILPVQNVSVVNVQRVDTWPPVDVPYTLIDISERQVVVEDVPFPVNMTVANITGIAREGMYSINVRVATPNGTDVGTFWFDLSSFRAELSYRGMYEWPPLYSSGENLTVTVSAFNFDGSPHQLSQNATRLTSLFDIKRGTPVRVNSSTLCQGNVCNITVELSPLKSGEYDARIRIGDTQGAVKEDGVWFRVRDLILGIPSIEEVWLWDTDTSKKTLKLFGIDPAQLVPPGNYTTSYEGCTSNMIENEWFFSGQNITPRPLCFFHNTTELWVSQDANFTGAPSAAVGGLIQDPYGAIWRVESLNREEVTLRGMNVLASTGAWLNTSLSKSGVIRMGRMDEAYLGGWDPSTGQPRGLDLNGDGDANDTAYVAIADSRKAGVYDTLFFSFDSNFSSYASVMDPPAKRTFAGGRFTLLSIDPRADRVRIYTRGRGDWAELGDVRVGDVVNLPVMVTTPAGMPVVANITVSHVRVDTAAGAPVFLSLSPPVTATINGTGEVAVNLSQYNLSSGTYAFEIAAEVNGTLETLEEWMWPRVTVRSFLVSTTTGMAAYAGEFRPLPMQVLDWRNYSSIPEVFEVTGGVNFSMAMEVLDGSSIFIGGCTDPLDAGAGENYTLRSYRLSDPAGDYFFYVSTANSSTLWVRKGDCNFAAPGTEVYPVNASINITLEGRVYIMSVLAAEAYPGGQALVVIGVPDSSLNQNLLSHPLMEDASGGRWRILSFSAGGRVYNAILANSSAPYPLCELQGILECAKAAYFTTDGNYSDSGEVLAGMPVANGSELYLAKIGPGAYDGIAIANSSLTGVRAAVDVMLEDGYVPMLGVLSESALGVDLNLNGNYSEVFYAVLGDDSPDGVPAPTLVLVDDDLALTQPWWGEGFNGSQVLNPKDFYGSEGGSMVEQMGQMPTDAWSGMIGFGPYNESLGPEEQPFWSVKHFNGTHMLLVRDRWVFNDTDTLSFMLSAYDFDRTPIAGANVSIASVVVFTPLGPKVLQEGTDYTTSGSGTTDSSGYAVISLSPVTRWQEGDYSVSLRVEGPGGKEKIDVWLRIGGW